MTDTASPSLAPASPELAAQIAAVDAIKVAAAIVAQGKRAAVAASTVDVIAMAQLLTALVRITDMTFDMLFTADRLDGEASPIVRRAIADQVRAKIFAVAGELEAIGYSVSNPTITAPETSTHGVED
ncbi:hypothetical protein X566_15480 [Afipia sp. P52-10]|uniref:hypothetical protein n=1 Tax=Afipia sp. P52-10 TaxID=1429916 RepID=UPI0003DF37C1|nr:hypothetical protein [Afipia sp. P52-10]ETR79170.1 hypothetical protein X566_15480 [Afipia sp. P52-10]